MTSRFVSGPERGGRLRWTWSAISILFLVPRSVAAQALPLELSWRAPPECPSRQAVLHRVRTLLGASVPRIATLRVAGEIDKREDGFELRLSVEDGGRLTERRVPAAQCDELGGAAAVALVLFLAASEEGADPTAAASGTGSDGDTSVPPPPPAPTVDVPSAPRANESQLEPAPVAGPRRWRVLIAAPQLALMVGPLPKPSLGLGAGLGVEGPGWAVRLLGQWSPTQAIAAPVAGYGADVRRLSAALWACWQPSRSAWTLSPCVQFGAMHLQATGFGPFLASASASNTSFSAGLGAIGRARLASTLAMMVTAGADVELSRPVILLGTIGPVRQLAPVSAAVLLGPEWIF